MLLNIEKNEDDIPKYLYGNAVNGKREDINFLDFAPNPLYMKGDLHRYHILKSNMIYNGHITSIHMQIVYLPVLLLGPVVSIQHQSGRRLEEL